jgi:MFS family permease
VFAALPTSLALVLAVTPAKRRGRAIRPWSAVSAMAAALGPVIGGLLVQASWRWVFLTNLPIGILASFSATLTAAGAAALPAERFATGTGILTRLAILGRSWVPPVSAPRAEHAAHEPR